MTKDVVVAVYEHRHGTDVRVFTTEAPAIQWRIAIAESWWSKEMPTDVQKPADDQEMADTYFDFMGCQGDRSDYFNTYQSTVEGDETLPTDEQSHADSMATMLKFARKALQTDPKLPQASTRQEQAAWLDDLLVNFSEEIDELEQTKITGAPTVINWRTKDGSTLTFMPSDALSQLRLIARQHGLPDDVSDALEKFCIKLGNKLDAALTCVPTVKPKSKGGA